MAMKFGVEQKGQNFLAVNQTTGDVRGRFKDEKEAKKFAAKLQDDHNEGIRSVSGKVGPAKPNLDELE